MSEQPIEAGGQITATVTYTVPFGVFAEYAGMPGLVRAVDAAAGAELRLRVSEYDAAERRFSATLI